MAIVNVQIGSIVLLLHENENCKQDAGAHTRIFNLRDT